MNICMILLTGILNSWLMINNKSNEKRQIVNRIFVFDISGIMEPMLLYFNQETLSFIEGYTASWTPVQQSSIYICSVKHRNLLTDHNKTTKYKHSTGSEA